MDFGWFRNWYRIVFVMIVTHWRLVSKKIIEKRFRLRVILDEQDSYCSWHCSQWTVPMVLFFEVKVIVIILLHSYTPIYLFLFINNFIRAFLVFLCKSQVLNKKKNPKDGLYKLKIQSPTESTQIKICMRANQVVVIRRFTVKILQSSICSNKICS